NLHGRSLSMLRGGSLCRGSVFADWLTGLCPLRPREQLSPRCGEDNHSPGLEPPDRDEPKRSERERQIGRFEDGTRTDGVVEGSEQDSDNRCANDAQGALHRLDLADVVQKGECAPAEKEGREKDC